MSLFLDALACKNTGRAPIWLMRQAGRYMPEYRALRSKHSFLEMIHTPELQVEVTLQPIKAFAPDAAILFSDILTVAESLGVKVDFVEGKGPVLQSEYASSFDVADLDVKGSKERLHYIQTAIRELRKQLTVPLIGFCGAPFTVASYIIEGGSSKEFKKTKALMYNEPAKFKALLDAICTASIDYLRLQVEAGAQAIQIFDSWAHSLPHGQFREFSKAYLQRMAEGMPDVPVIVFAKGAYAHELATLPVSCVGLDSNYDMRTVRTVVPEGVAIQGNLDPAVMPQRKEVVLQEAGKILAARKGDKGFVFNLAHGVTPDVPVDNVRALVELVKNA